MEELPQDSVTADVVLTLGMQRLQMKVTVKNGPTEARDLLPLARSICETSVNLGVDEAQASGRSISCKKGCGACCRQIVPISETEARMIHDLVKAMPEPRRSEIRERFRQARVKLEQGGLLESLLNRAQWNPDSFEQFGLDYFYQGIPCPFLEEESCSIHPDRPLTCREYLVTSPAENCSRPTRENLDLVRIPLKVWPALARFHRPAPGSPFLRWVPLILALEWAENEAEERHARPGPEVVQEFFQNLTGEKVPGYVPFGT